MKIVINIIFIYIRIIESNVQMAVTTIKSIIASKSEKLLKKQIFSGAKILTTKLNSITV